MDDSPRSDTESVIAWLKADESNDLWQEARDAWDRSRGSITERLAASISELEQTLERRVVDSVPEHQGDLYSALLADSIGRIYWENVAAWLIARVAK